jgi:uncharacterized protein YuzE
MNVERHGFIVKSSTPPTVEVDSRARAVYVRFKRSAVAKTVSQKAELSHIAIDLDSKGEVIGFEAVGISNFSLHALLKMASVKVPNVDFSRTKYAPTECVPA